LQRPVQRFVQRHSQAQTPTASAIDLHGQNWREEGLEAER